MEMNFSGLKAAFAEAVTRHEPTLLFQINDGIGEFTFMIFLATDSNGKIKFNDLELFLIFGRTQKIFAFQIYGNFLNKGEFRIYLKDAHISAIRDELGIQPSAWGTPFDVKAFLERLNLQIPQSVPLTKKIELMQQQNSYIRSHCAKYVDEASKVYLIGPRAVTPPSKPREETLRKLYMLSEDPETIYRLIQKLKTHNWTTAWTDKIEKRGKFSTFCTKVFENRTAGEMPR
jgi:hypothetical protein